MPHPNTRLPVAERFELYVDRSGECHRWTGAHGSKGYGHFRYEGRMQKAHRVALLLAGIEVPDDLTVDHVWARGCRHKDCVRVDHLEIVPSAVNSLRGNNCAAINARKTHCPRGHEFTPENTAWSQLSDGRRRRCRTCKRAQSREQDARRRVAAGSAA